MKKKMCLFGVMVLLIGLVAMLTTGCGKKKVDLLSTVEVEFAGLDGYGTAYITGQDDWMEMIVDVDDIKDSDELALLGTYLQLQKAVKFSLSETEDLSNGDKIQLTVKVNEDLLKEYGIKVKETTKVIEVEGLREAQALDPFADMTVNVAGTAPQGYLDMQYNSKLSGLYISADKENNLSNGDVITFTLCSNNGEDVEAYAKEQGYKLTRTTMQHTVSGINSYIQSIDEISPEAMAKMQSQAEDVIDTVFAAGQCKSDEYSTCTNVTQMVSKEYAGCYLFTLKEGYGVSYSYPANLIYVVYKVTATSTDGNFTYYYALRFRNGMLLEGTEFTINLTDYDKTNDSFVKGYYTYTGKYFGSYDCEQSYYGYQDMASFKQSVMTDLVEKYSYTTNMQ